MILILIPKGLSRGVVSSQVLVFAKYLSHYKKVVLLADSNNHPIQNEEIELEIVEYSDKRRVKEVLKSAEWIYTRSAIQFIMYYYKRIYGRYDFKIYYDFRALAHNESYLRNQSRIREHVMYRIEKYASKKADQLGAVSNKLKIYLKTIFKTNVPIYVMPCCVEKAHYKNSEPSKEIRFVYMGGLSSWQCFDRMLSLYKEVAQKVEGVSLTIITREEKKALEKVKLYELKDVFVTSLSHNQVIRELPKYDFGFLIREKLLLNKVASPIKFIEYTSNGVIPILTDEIGDYSEEVISNNMGIVLKNVNQGIDIEDLHSYLTDKDIYKKLFDYSQGYTWGEYVSNHPLVK